MSKYNKVNDFAAKDAINAPVVGTEFQLEFNAIETAVNSKADSDNAVLTGVPVTPTPEGDTTNQIVNVNYVTEYTYDKENTVSSNLSFPAPQAQINALQTNIIKDTTNQNSAIKFSLGTSISFAFNNTDKVTITNSGLTASKLTSNTAPSGNNDVIRKADVTTANAIGWPVWAHVSRQAGVNYGDTISGSDLRLLRSEANPQPPTGSPLPGTWRAASQVINRVLFEDAQPGLFVRIS